MEIYYIVYIIYPLLSLVVGYIGYLYKNLQNKIDGTLSEEQIRNLLDDKIRPIQEQQDSLKENIRHLMTKIDSIIQMLLEMKFGTSKIND